MCFGYFLVELKSIAEFPKKLFPLNLPKKVSETIYLASTCADLFMQSLATGGFRLLAPIQTKTRLAQNVSLPSYLPVI